MKIKISFRQLVVIHLVLMLILVWIIFKIKAKENDG